MLAIRAARADEFEKVRGFYHRLIDMMEGLEFHPRWEKFVYPADDFLHGSIERGELYVGMLGEEIAAAMVINGEGADGYDSAPWSVSAARGEFSVIHTLGVMPAYHGRGLASATRRCASTCSTATCPPSGSTSRRASASSRAWRSSTRTRG